MFMRSSLIPAALLCLTLGASAQTTPSKVGVISIQGAIVGTKDGQKASQDLDAKFVPRKKDFDTRQSEIAQLQDQYNKSGTVMSEEKRNQLARDIDEKKKRLERDMQDAEEDLKGEQQKVLQGLGQRMMAVIEKYAKDNGYSMILDVSNPNTPVLYASSGIDITQDIVSLYDKTTVGGAPAPTAAKPGTPTRSPAAKTPGTPK
jgi:outer membrane protein